MPNWVRQQATFYGKKENLDKMLQLIIVGEERIKEVNEINKKVNFCQIVQAANKDKDLSCCDKCDKKRCGLTQHLPPNAFELKIPSVGHVDFGILIPQPELIYNGGTNDKIKKEVESLGGTDWYGWNCENWGTKWNACESGYERYGDECFMIGFDTAWSMADEWWIRVGEEAKKLGIEITGCYADEDFGGAMGTIHLNESDDEITITCCPEDEEIYEDVWGFNPLEDELQDEFDSED